MTELRRRMDEAMVVRGMADRTRETYLWAVEGLARYYRRSPDQISDQEVQDYLRHLLRDRHRSWSTMHIVVHGLRFFYHTTLKRDRTTFEIPGPRQPVQLPVVLSAEEIARVLAQTTSRKHRTMLLTTYAAGLRLNEVIHLRTREILEKIKDRCQDHLGRLAAGVYLTGGVSLMKGIDGVARDVFGIKVTRAGSAQVSGVTAMFENPQFSTPIGLIRYAQILDSEKPFLSPLARLGRRMADLLSCWTF